MDGSIIRRRYIILTPWGSGHKEPPDARRRRQPHQQALHSGSTPIPAAQPHDLTTSRPPLCSPDPLPQSTEWWALRGSPSEPTCAAIAQKGNLTCSLACPRPTSARPLVGALSPSPSAPALADGGGNDLRDSFHRERRTGSTRATVEHPEGEKRAFCSGRYQWLVHPSLGSFHFSSRLATPPILLYAPLKHPQSLSPPPPARRSSH
jgi:hypothetical protein